jgi:phenylalanine-4-hydroxylase
MFFNLFLLFISFKSSSSYISKNIWFPKKIDDLDLISKNIIKSNICEKTSTFDHPFYSDQKYNIRKNQINKIVEQHCINDIIPIIEYDYYEHLLWTKIYNLLKILYPKYACSKYNENFYIFENYFDINQPNITQKNIPQINVISNFLENKTGFKLIPISGLLSNRDFLNALAYKVFFSTIYIRHHQYPFYNPEPCCIHEFLGHVPLLADPFFSDLYQEIGKASLGASDEDIKKLSRCFWFTLEFGLIKENNKVKAYGAGLLSSIGELQYSCEPTLKVNDPMILPFDLNVICNTDYVTNNYQNKYFIADSLDDVNFKLRSLCNYINKYKKIYK